METKSPEPKKTPATNGKKEEKSGNSSLIIVLVISILANIGLGVGMFIFMSKSNEQESIIASLNGEITTKDAEVVAKTHELENLQLDLERIKEERERLGLSNDSLSMQIADLGTTIAKLRRTAKLDSKTKAKLERMIADLRTQIVEKDQQIATLTVERDSLASGLTAVSEEKMKLGDSLRDAASALAYAAVLKAEELKIVGVKENGKEFGGDGDELKGTKIDRLKVTFSIADNKAAKHEEKGIFVALTTPNGEVFSDPNNGGGMLTLADGNDALYTMNQSLNFDNSNQEMSFTMLKGFSYNEGKYMVTIYSGGYKIGEGSFKVK